MNTLRRLTLRGRFMGLVLFGVLLPLGLVGFWLIRSSQNSGVELVRARLVESLAQIVDDFGREWSANHSLLLNLAESGAVTNALRGSVMWPPPQPSSSYEELSRRWGDVADFAWLIEINDHDGRPLARLPDDIGERRAPISPPFGFLNYEIPVRARMSGEDIGALVIRFRTDALLRTAVSTGGMGGSMLSIRDRRSGSWLMPLPIDPDSLSKERFMFRDQPWLSATRDVVDPPLSFTLAAPLEPITEPLNDAARRGTLALLLAVIAAFTLATLFAHRLTSSLGGLSGAARAVASGDLEARAPEAGSPEVRATARAFNAMSQTLRDTLDRLSQREALAAVGEFAASLAHEVRNPLTSIRMDLERCQRRLESDPDGARALTERALGEIDRLNASVTDFLRVARSGHVTLRPIDLRAPLEAAVRAAAPRFAEKAGELVYEGPAAPLLVEGEEGSLEQLVLNLLLNAADAIPDGGRAAIVLDVRTREVVVSVQDEGRGVPPSERERVFEPFFTTREQGTGLGLAIARRIARAHGSELELEGADPEGATFRFRLRLCPGEAARIITDGSGPGHEPVPPAPFAGTDKAR
jgi:signal transduction histidine kinase